MNQLAKDPELEEIIIPDYTNPFSATVKVAIEVLVGEIENYQKNTQQAIYRFKNAV